MTTQTSFDPTGQLLLARKYLSIADSVDGDPDKAKHEAYRAAAQCVTTHIAKTGETQKEVATKLKLTPQLVAKLLKWHRDGAQTVTPWRDADGSDRKDQSAYRAHAKRVLRSPADRRQVLAAMTDDERQAVATELLSDRKLVRSVVAPGSPVRAAIKDESEDDFVREARHRRIERQHNRLPTSLDQYFYGVLTKLTSYTTALQGIESELAALSGDRKAHALGNFERLRDECQRCINILGGLPAEGPSDDGDVIDVDGRTVERGVRHLTA